MNLVRVPTQNTYAGGTIGHGVPLLLNETIEPLMWCGYNGIDVTNIDIEYSGASISSPGPGHPVAFLYYFNTKEEAAVFKLRWI